LILSILFSNAQSSDATSLQRQSITRAFPDEITLTDGGIEAWARGEIAWTREFDLTILGAVVELINATWTR
jgi:hypothetical protein